MRLLVSSKWQDPHSAQYSNITCLHLQMSNFHFPVILLVSKLYDGNFQFLFSDFYVLPAKEMMQLGFFLFFFLMSHTVGVLVSQ